MWLRGKGPPPVPSSTLPRRHPCPVLQPRDPHLGLGVQRQFPRLSPNPDLPPPRLCFFGHVSGNSEGGGFTQVALITSEVQPRVIFP